MNNKKLFFVSTAVTAIFCGISSFAMQEDQNKINIFKSNWNSVAIYLAHKFYTNNCSEDELRPGCIQRLDHGWEHGYDVAKGAEYGIGFYVRHEYEGKWSKVIKDIDKDPRQKRLFKVSAYLHDLKRRSDKGRDLDDKKSAQKIREVLKDHGATKEESEFYSKLISEKKGSRSKCAGIIRWFDSCAIARARGWDWWLNVNKEGKEREPRFFDIFRPCVFKDFNGNNKALTEAYRYGFAMVRLFKHRYELFRPCPVGKDIEKMARLVKKYGIQKIGMEFSDIKDAKEKGKLIHFSKKKFMKKNKSFFGTVLKDRKDIDKEDRKFFYDNDMNFSISEKEKVQLLKEDIDPEDPKPGRVNSECFKIFEKQHRVIEDYAKGKTDKLIFS